MQIQLVICLKVRKGNKMTAYALNDSKMYMDVADGIAIVINSETGIYYGLNGFGTIVLEALSKGIDSGIVLEKVKAVQGAPADLEQRFSSFVEELVKEELLISASAQDLDFVFDEKIVADDQFQMEIKPYSDAQEMLLADPIHEVKESVGWTPEKDSIGYTKEETKEREKKIEE